MVISRNDFVRGGRVCLFYSTNVSASLLMSGVHTRTRGCRIPIVVRTFPRALTNRGNRGTSIILLKPRVTCVLPRVRHLLPGGPIRMVSSLLCNGISNLNILGTTITTVGGTTTGWFVLGFPIGRLFRGSVPRCLGYNFWKCFSVDGIVTSLRGMLLPFTIGVKGRPRIGTVGGNFVHLVPLALTKTVFMLVGGIFLDFKRKSFFCSLNVHLSTSAVRALGNLGNVNNGMCGKALKVVSLVTPFFVNVTLTRRHGISTLTTKLLSITTFVAIAPCDINRTCTINTG